MAKKIVQDVVPPESKSIRNIPVAPRRRSSLAQTQTFTPPTPSAPRQLDSRRTSRVSAPPTTKSEETFFSEDPVPSQTPSYYNKKKSKKGLLILAGVCVLGLGFAISILLSSAVVEIKPKSEIASLNTSLVAKKAPTEGELGYEIITLSKEVGKSVEASGEEKVEKKASGRIVVYNKYSKDSQKLIANTRFETPQGLIYRISDPVTIPGYTTKNNEIVPGSVTVTVYADKVGTAYNIGLSDFTVPGFKGDPRFSKIYARSETVMQGGFTGTVKKVTPEVLASAEESIKTDLKAELMTELKAQIPDNFVLYNGATSFGFEDLDQTNITEKSVTINQKGTIYGVVFDKNILNNILSKDTLTPAKPGEVYISNIDNLDILLSNSITPDKLKNQDVSFVIKGSANFVWIIDQSKIKQDLAGKPKKNFNSTMSTYPSVEKGRAVLSPIWNRSFPNNINKIEVKVEENQ